MSITGELKFADDAFKPTAETLKLLYGETWGKGYDMGFDAGYASADDWFVDHAEELAEHGWIRLPVDADGVPIRVGDWITGKWDAKAKVVAVTSDEVYWWEPDGCHWCHASEVRHYHEPTVEDVLREFAKCWDDPAHYAKGELVEAFAAKLQLRED